MLDAKWNLNWHAEWRKATLDTLIGINRVETQTRLEHSLPKLGNKSRLYKIVLTKLGNESKLYKIVVLKHKLLECQL